MASLAISLLGTFEVAGTGPDAARIESDKVRLLLAYLAVEATHAHRREALAALFWPEMDQTRASQNLRHSLYNLRQAGGAADEAAPLLLISRHDVRFNAAAHRLDVAGFLAALDAAQRHSHWRADTCAFCAERRREAVALYRGDFLAGLAPVDSEALEDWRLFKQEEYRSRLLEALLSLAAYHERRREYEAAARYLRRVIELEPWREEGQRRLMRALALGGQRAAALQQFELCRRVLLEELGLAPAPETAELYRRIAAGELRPASDPGENPYKGLAAFTEQDAGIFFGRETLVARALELLHSRALVVVVGASGAGKSSFIRAGVLPRLNFAAPVVGSDEQWLIAGFRPGDQPFAALAEAFLPLLESHPGAGPTALAAELASGATSLATLVARALKRARQRQGTAADIRLLLVADQFEELYTLCADPATRLAFLDLLLGQAERARRAPVAADAAAPGTALHILISLRADFTGQSLAYRPLADAIQEGGLMVGPMRRDELRQAIVEPLRLCGMVFEPGLVERLLDDVAGEPGNLPLLEFALTLLWGQRREDQLTHEAYEEIGGVAGALTSYAEHVYSQLAPAEQEAARRVFAQLVQPGEGASATRRVASRADLGEQNWRLASRLAAARLLVMATDPLGRETAELVHEALIANWGRLREWLEEGRAFHVWHNRLRVGMTHWEETGRDPGGLLRGVALSEAAAWLDGHGDDLSRAAAGYIEASLARRRAEQQDEAERGRRELAQAQALAASERRRADDEASAHEHLRRLADDLTKVSWLALGAAKLAQRQESRAIAAADLARSLNLISAARLALSEHNTDLALTLAVAAQAIPGAPPEAGLVLSQAAYAPGTIRLLEGHTAAVFGLTVSADGAQAISASADGTLILWDVASGALLRRFSGHDGPVYGVAFSPDGQLAVSASADGLLILWDVASGLQLRRFAGHTAAVRAVAFTPAGNRIVSASADTTLAIWDVATGEMVARLRGHDAAVYCLALSPDGRRAASGSADRSVILWDLDRCVLEQRFAGQTDSVGGFIAAHGHWFSIWGVAFTPDGRRVVSAGEDECIAVWDVAEHRLITQFKVESGHFSLALSHDGETAIVGTLDNSILAVSLTPPDDLRLTTPLRQQLRGHVGRVHTLALADYRTLISGSADGALRVWDLRNGAEVRRLIEQSYVAASLALAPNEQFGLLGLVDGRMLLWDHRSGAQLRELHGHSEMLIAGVHFTPDSRYAVSGSGDSFGISADHTVRVWDVAAGQEIACFAGHSDKLWDTGLTPDGCYVVSGAHDGTVRVWAIAGGAGRTLRDFSPQVPRSLAVSPDGRQVLVGPGKGASSMPNYDLRLLDLATGAEVRRFAGHTEAVRAVAFAPDSQTAASAGLDKKVLLWRIASGELLHVLEGQAGSLPALAFSPDGRSLAGADMGSQILLWDVASGSLLRVLKGHNGPVVDLCFSPGSRTIVSTSFDGTVREWRIDENQQALQQWISANRYIPALTSRQHEQYGLSNHSGRRVRHRSAPRIRKP